ncbi:hypothetical protein EJ04DRAFT_480370 [Polyplosphaeria fusca]|uniref:Nascent polypeptide-associated complex subunit alpha-like UBA domain-containing protein n=1 Tax=Polyplosphaeria fusca TaxID=682080 RepID=A0A9P4QHM8_9PLEO|nr:hypothetical protein EJ04DRAFT_480370 [Polyplosphaeria fusca]
MAEEPQPSNIHEGASDGPAPTGTAEDRKAAAALSTLDAHDDESAQKSSADSKALGEAMKNLDVSEKKPTEEKKKVIKVDASDVALLVDQLDITKIKATELLRQHDGDAVKAMSTFVTVFA